MKIAIVGGGVSGLVAAYALRDVHDVTVFEAEPQIGGHARTVTEEVAGTPVRVDTGFVVFNRENYPAFLMLLERLGVQAQPTTMSFSVRDERTGLEYCGTSLNTIFAQRRNLLRPRFLGMLRDIFRFNRDAVRLLAQGIDAPTLEEYLRARGYGSAFVEQYILPMGAALWSATPEQVFEFPASFFVQFFENHGMLSATKQFDWLTVRGGSATYVTALATILADRVRVGAPVRGIRRDEDAVRVRAGGQDDEESFDAVVMAAHSDQALEMLDDPTSAEREILGAFAYQENDGVLHTDASFLPRSRRAWASWNYTVPESPSPRVAVTYNMTTLQRLPTEVPVCITLNPTREVEPDRVLRRLRWSHPLYTPQAIAAQARRDEISGVGRTFYCGAYWGNGFHEAGAASGLAVAEALGATW